LRRQKDDITKDHPPLLHTERGALPIGSKGTTTSGETRVFKKSQVITVCPKSIRTNDSKKMMDADEDDASHQSELQRQLQAMGLTSGIEFDKEEFEKMDADSVVSLGDESYVKDLVGQRERRDQERREEVMEDAKDRYLAAVKEQGLEQPNEGMFLDIYDGMLRENADKFEEEDRIQDERLLAALEEITNRPPDDDSWKLDAVATRQKRIDDDAKKMEAITRRKAWEQERQKAILARKKNEEARRGAWENAQAKELSDSQTKMETFQDEMQDDDSNMVALQYRSRRKPDPIDHEEMKADRRKLQKKWILLFVVIFAVIAVAALCLALLGGKDDDPEVKVFTFETDPPTTSAPTIAPSTRPPTIPTKAPVFATLSPTVTESETPTVFTPEAIVTINYDLLIRNGTAANISSTDFIPDLIASMDILAPLVWLEANAASTGIRFLAEATVQTPTSISEVVETGTYSRN
jgi:hypothetical protein